MKLLKLGLRFWITLTSLFSFLTGWILLAHAPKPTSSTSSNTSISPAVTPLPTLAPLQPLSGSDDNNSQNQQPSFSFVQPQAQFQSRPFFSSGGS